MRAVVQRVSSAEVRVAGTTVGQIQRGLVVLLGVGLNDNAEIATIMAAKICGLRIFEDSAGKMNLDCEQIGGALLCISQFTLYGDTRRGNRPSFSQAAPGPIAEPVYEQFLRAVEARGLRCQRGIFGAHMQLELVNDGPVTIVVDSDDMDRPRRA